MEPEAAPQAAGTESAADAHGERYWSCNQNVSTEAAPQAEIRKSVPQQCLGDEIHLSQHRVKQGSADMHDSGCMQRPPA